MSTTFLRGLAMLEVVGVDGPIGVSELARRVDADKATVSRMVSAAAEDGWLVRTPDGVTLGPRLSVLAYASDLAGSLRDAQPLVDAVAGVTGLFTHVYLAVGHGIMPVLAGGRPPVILPRPPGLEMPIWSIAAGRAVASLMTRAALEALLPAGQLPGAVSVPAVGKAVAGIEATGVPVPGDVGSAAVTTRAGFLDAVDEVRRTQVAYDHGDVHPLIHCIAVPWPGLGEPAAICVIGAPQEVAAEAELVEALLQTVVSPGATRDRVVMRAAEVTAARGASAQGLPRGAPG